MGRFVAAVLFCILAPASHAQTPAGQLPFVTLAAGSKSSGNTGTTAWATDYGSYDVTFRQSVGIEVKVRNMSRQPESLLMRVIFFAKTAGTNSRSIFSLADRKLEMKAGEELAEVLPSPLMENRDQNYAAIGVRYQEGSRYEGWLVQMLTSDGKQLIRQIGSTSYLEDLTKSPVYAEMLTDYRKNAKEER